MQTIDVEGGGKKRVARGWDGHPTSRDCATRLLIAIIGYENGPELARVDRVYEKVALVRGLIVFKLLVFGLQEANHRDGSWIT